MWTDKNFRSVQLKSKLDQTTTVLTARGNVDITGDSVMTGSLGVTGDVDITGDSIMTGTLGLTGTGTFENLNINGNVGIGSSSPTKVLDVASTTSGMVLPRMTTTERDAISSPVAGELVYNTTTNKLCCYDGTIWNDCWV